MSVIYIVLPLAILFAVFAVLAFIWAVGDGQLDDLDTPPIRACFDDEAVKQKPESLTGPGTGNLKRRDRQ